MARNASALTTTFGNLAEARVSVFKYSETFYNIECLPQTLGYQTPTNTKPTTSRPLRRLEGVERGMTSPFIAKRRVEFSDTDMAGIAHFTSYFRFMESAEHEFLRSRGLSVVIEEEGRTDTHISWPRVSASCDFQAAARFGDELDIEVVVERIGDKSVAYKYLIGCQGRPLAVGRMTCVCCRIAPGRRPESIVIPPEIRAKLQGAVE